MNDEDERLSERMRAARTDGASFDGIEDIAQDIVKLYHERLSKFAEYKAQTPDDAQDLLATLYAKLPKIIHNFSGGAPMPYLVTALKNVAKDMQRVSAHMKTTRMMDILANPDPQLDAQLDLQTLVALGTASMNPKWRNCFVYSVVHELNSPQISALSGKPEGTVRSNLTFARRHMRESYGAELRLD